ncbi:MAG TPA: vanadium-dependent haloperoxidase [Vicinamibacterales bacterium]|nr:vanadium-dependent haloperoxidase [Vicinamibacterales bacterium]
MTSGMTHIGGGVGRSIMRVVLVMLIAGLVSGRASADDMVLKWNEIASRTVLATNPFNQARIMAITQLAVFEAVNAVTGDYEPYLATPTAASPGASADAAVIVAAHKVLTNYFSAAATVALLDAARDADLGAIPNGAAKTDGIAVGLAAANALIALRQNSSGVATDGSATPPLTNVPTSTVPGDYQLTTGCAASSFYNWPGVTPFAIRSPADFLLPPPPALDSQKYTKDYYEVHTVGAANSADRPPDRTDNSRLYAGTSPNFALSMATRQIATAKGLSMSENARALALIMMGINDSLIASFYNKYHYNLWRPETGIRNGASDDNGKTDGDTGFTTFISTPCFPSYPSNHASGTNGGLEVMRRLFGAAGHDITITNTVPALGALPSKTITQHYTQLQKIADDVDDARVYGGIHWRFDQVGGNDLGRAIATEVAKNHLRPIHP